MKFTTVTIFPNVIKDYCNESILERAQKEKFIAVNAVQLRDFAFDRHQSVDDTPYGGGPGMVIRADVISRALASLGVLKKNSERRKEKKCRVILLSPRGKQFDQRMAEQWAKLDELVMVCGRYEGVDQRVADHMVDEEISIGPYVLAGGELGALTIIEAVARLIPGVLGNEESLKEETTSAAKEYPQYTRPEIFNKWRVPDILLGGHHKKIADWRRIHTPS